MEGVTQHRHQWVAEPAAHVCLRLRITSLEHLQQSCPGMARLAAPLQSVSRGSEWWRLHTTFAFLPLLRWRVWCIVSRLLPVDVNLGHLISCHAEFKLPETHRKCMFAVSTWLLPSILCNTFLHFLQVVRPVKGSAELVWVCLCRQMALLYSLVSLCVCVCVLDGEQAVQLCVGISLGPS